MKRFLRRLRFGWPDILKGAATRNEYENVLAKEEVERRRIKARLRALEVEYNIPPRKE